MASVSEWERPVLGLFLLLCVAVVSPTATIDSANCMSMGYTSSLMCSSCRELKEFGLQALETECGSCCQPDGAGDDGKVNNKIHFPYSIVITMVNILKIYCGYGKVGNSAAPGAIL